MAQKRGQWRASVIHSSKQHSGSIRVGEFHVQIRKYLFLEADFAPWGDNKTLMLGCTV
jgi:hypothetical protein